MNKATRRPPPGTGHARGRKPPGNAYRRYGFGFALLALLLCLLLRWLHLVSSLLNCWLIAISVTTFIAFGIDKLSAINHRLRVPEWVLIGLAFVGGTVGALLAMGIFHHKTAKRSFQWRFWLAMAAQVAVIVVYYALVPRW